MRAGLGLILVTAPVVARASASSTPRPIPARHIEHETERMRSAWLSMCAGDAITSPCCLAWRDKVSRSIAQLAMQLEDEHLWLSNVSRVNSRDQQNAQQGLFTTSFDVYEPTWNCELRVRTPHKAGDGPKWTCGLDALSGGAATDAAAAGADGASGRDSCIVYSFGSNNDVSFERAVKSAAPGCKIWTFDPTIDKTTGAGGMMGYPTGVVTEAEREGLLTFMSIGIAGADGSFTFGNKTFPTLSLASIRSRLGHVGRLIDVLKIDVEGSEFGVLAQDAPIGSRRTAAGGGSLALGSIGQLLIEVHSRRFVMIAALMRRIRQHGLMMFSKEPNLWAPPQVGCAEFSFVGREHAFRAFRATHPSCHATHGGTTSRTTGPQLNPSLAA